MKTRLVIIGGSDAGISAALRAREIDREAKVTVVVADAFPNYSVCGLPFFLSGEVGDWHNLAHRTAEEITREGIELLLNHTARSIDPDSRTVLVIDKSGDSRQIAYDRLIIGTGAMPLQPAIAGLELPGVYPLRTMGDSFAVHRHLQEPSACSVVIIGGGYIGLEMADALTLRKLDVTLIEHSPTVLKTVDPILGRLAAAELEKHRVRIINSVGVEAIERTGERLTVHGLGGFYAEADLVLVSVGVTPQVALAQTAGVRLGVRDAIQVNRRMETSVPGIYAAGDCTVTWHRLLERDLYLPLGTTAHKQGRVAGENAVGGNCEFAGSLGTQVVKLFELAVARTGLRDDEACQAGFDPLTVEFESWDHKAYYPGAHRLHFLITGDKQSGRLLGAQLAGHRHAEVSKRIDIFATALFHSMTVEGMSDLDLSYTPPFSSPWDPVQMAAQAWSKARNTSAVSSSSFQSVS